MLENRCSMSTAHTSSKALQFIWYTEVYYTYTYSIHIQYSTEVAPGLLGHPHPHYHPHVNISGFLLGFWFYSEWEVLFGSFAHWGKSRWMGVNGNRIALSPRWTYLPCPINWIESVAGLPLRRKLAQPANRICTCTCACICTCTCACIYTCTCACICTCICILTCSMVKRKLAQPAGCACICICTCRPGSCSVLTMWEVSMSTLAWSHPSLVRFPPAH